MFKLFGWLFMVPPLFALIGICLDVLGLFLGVPKAGAFIAVAVLLSGLWGPSLLIACACFAVHKYLRRDDAQAAPPVEQSRGISNSMFGR